MFKSYCHRTKGHRASQTFTPAQIAALYNFPKLLVSSDCVISIIELGGGYRPAMIQQQFQSWGLPPPVLTDESINGGKNAPGQDADTEVVLDIVVAAAVYSWMTGRPAQVRMLFAPNTDAGFIRAAQLATGMCSISWGAPEDQWSADAIAQMDKAFALNSRTRFFCAAGDAGDSDGEQGKHADYPGSSLYGICCGGTTIVVQNGKIVNEVPWNHDGGAGGGGFSAVEVAPAWQVPFIPPGKGRGVPDFSANADPATGYQTPMGVVGGTSAVAPLMAGYFAALTAAGVQFTAADIYKAHATFRDITLGNNTTVGARFDATTGWDAATGLGVPDGTLLYQALQGNDPAPPVPPAPPPNPPPPIPIPAPASPSRQDVLNAIDKAMAFLEKKNPFYASAFKIVNKYLDQEVGKLWIAPAVNVPMWDLD